MKYGYIMDVVMHLKSFPFVSLGVMKTAIPAKKQLASEDRER